MDMSFNSFNPFPYAPVPPAELIAGTVLGFVKAYREDGPGYSFAAIRVAGKARGWYVTGPNYAGQPMTWEELLEFIGGPAEWSQVGIVTSWAPLYVDPMAASNDTAPGTGR